MLRSTGLAYDIRINEPYDSYDDFDFKIPVGINGDCFDRYLMRIYEMRESCNIILQVLNNIPTGPIKLWNNKVVIPDNYFIKNDMETLINHFKLFSEGYSIPKGETYTVIEAPKGEFGVFLISNNTSKPYRCKIKSPGFLHLQSLDFMVKNHMVADLVTIIGTQDIVFGEIDR